mmetsp:Transcript_7106/g.16648  ORF Transcript_7106/g.16648 Transcript_7106/m.16648 type:complete len:225 (+) Transcript_7106:4822-5496(+)
MAAMAGWCGVTSLQWPTMPCSTGIALQPSRAMSASHCSGLPAMMHDLLSLTISSRTHAAAAPIAPSAPATASLSACSTKPCQKEATGASAGTPHAERSAPIGPASSRVHTGEAASCRSNSSDFLALAAQKAKSIDTSPRERPHAARGTMPSSSRATEEAQKEWKTPARNMCTGALASAAALSCAAASEAARGCHASSDVSHMRVVPCSTSSCSRGATRCKSLPR